jgi:hypothetical protein
MFGIIYGYESPKLSYIYESNIFMTNMSKTSNVNKGIVIATVAVLALGAIAASVPMNVFASQFGGNGGIGGPGGNGGNGAPGGSNEVEFSGGHNSQHANGGDANGGHGGNAPGGNACHNRCGANS